jgi:hypothetical protein
MTLAARALSAASTDCCSIFPTQQKISASLIYHVSLSGKGMAASEILSLLTASVMPFGVMGGNAMLVANVVALGL